jgi:hypothetical protein
MGTYKEKEKKDFMVAYFNNNANMSRTCKETGVPYCTGRSWLTQDWFKQAWEQFVSRRQMAITTKLLNDPTVLSDAMLDILNENGDPKFANAKFKIFEATMKSGSDPVIKNRPELTIIKQNNEINVNTIEKLSMPDIMALAKGETIDVTPDDTPVDQPVLELEQ